jgi:hypothetical protein
VDSRPWRKALFYNSGGTVAACQHDLTQNHLQIFPALASLCVTPRGRRSGMIEA